MSDLATALQLDVAGDGALEIERPATPETAGPKDIAIAMSPEFAKRLPQGQARVAILWLGADWREFGLDAAILAPRSRVALAGVTAAFAPPSDLLFGIHPTAVIDSSAVIGPEQRIGPFVTIGPEAQIGSRAQIHANVSIGAGARIGDDAILHSGVKIGARIRVGHRFIAHPNAVIGSDGFSFVTPERGRVEAAREDGDAEAGQATNSFLRVHSIGGVVIGDDVEVGANSAIDRGTIADTEVGDDTKIDNLVQIGHNVHIGRACLICGQAGIAGSAKIGDRVVLGGKSGVADNVKIGSDVLVAAAASVGTHLTDGAVVMGSPAIPRAAAQRSFLEIRRLPRLAAEVARLRELLKQADRND